MKNNVQILVQLPRSLVGGLDRLRECEGFSSRTELVRSIIREKLIAKGVELSEDS